MFIFGARGFAKQFADTIEKQALYEIAFLFDDDASLKGKEVYGYKVLCGRQNLITTHELPIPAKAIVAIGDNKVRVEVAQWLLDKHFELVTVVHPWSQQARGVSIGSGTIVMAGVAINSDTTVGDSVVLNTGATIGHDCVIGDGAHISSGCHLCGHVTVGINSLLGAGTDVIPGITIGNNVTVGAGSTVIRDIPDGQRVAGSPCHPISPK